MTKLPPTRFFPPVETADTDGLLCVGGSLSPPWLLDAYRHGIFPWPMDDDLLAWWSPDPRAVLEFDGLHVSRRLARTLRSEQFEVTCDRDFAAVIQRCATVQDRRGATWLTRPMRRAYRRMHELGFVHSVEAWQDGELAGAVYGVALGASFSAESMFYRVRDASKVALVHLVRHLKARGFHLLDIQQITPHLRSMGAKTIPRGVYIERLTSALEKDVSFGESLEGDR